MATGLVVVEFIWHHSIAWPWKSHVIRKNIMDISFISRVISDFVPNFVAMATGVGHGRIWLASFNSLTLKTPCYTQKSPGYLLYKPSYGRLVLNFVAIATGVGRCKIWLTPFDSPTPITPYQTQTSKRYLLYKPSYSRFCPKFRCHSNGGRSW